MSRQPWLTPEEALKKQERKKRIFIASVLFATVLLSAGLTILANQI